MGCQAAWPWRAGDYERFVEAITYQDGRCYADARGPKDLYSEDVESMGLFGAVISKMEVRKMQRRMRSSHRARAAAGKPPGGTRPFGWSEDRLTLDAAEALRTRLLRPTRRGRAAWREFQDPPRLTRAHGLAAAPRRPDRRAVAWPIRSMTLAAESRAIFSDGPGG